MRKYINFIKISLVVLVLGLSGCYEQEVAPIVEPGGLGYTTATFTTDFTGNEVTEGDTITYTITLSKPIEYDLKFTLQFDGDLSDIEYPEDGVTIPAYSTEAKFQIVFVYDNIPEEDEAISYEIGIYNVNYQYLLHNTTYPNPSLTIKNKNDSNGLTVAVEWPDHGDDWDCYMIDENGAGIYGGKYDWVGFAGATGADPEIMILKDQAWVTVTDGVYYVDVDPYAVGNDKTDFKVSIGHPDQTVEFINFTFDKSKAGDYPTTWGYSAVKIVKAGMKFTCTLSPEFASE